MRRDDLISDHTHRLWQLATEHLRPPSRMYNEDGADFIEFDPPLTTEEQAIFDTLSRIAAMLQPMTVAQYDAVRPQIQTGRQRVRQLTQSEWMALTNAQRERATYDVLKALVEIAIIDHRD